MIFFSQLPPQPSPTITQTPDSCDTKEFYNIFIFLEICSVPILGAGGKDEEGTFFTISSQSALFEQLKAFALKLIIPKVKSNESHGSYITIF